MANCTAIIKAGANAGKECSGVAVEGTDKCARHAPRDPEANKNRTTCTAIIKNGENAGKQCTAFAREGTVLCGRHTPRAAAPKKEGPICTALIKNGANAGKQCTTVAREGSDVCGRHAPRTPKADGEVAPKKAKKTAKKADEKKVDEKKADGEVAPKKAKKTTKKADKKKADVAPKADGEVAPKKANKKTKKVKNTDGTVCTALIKNGVNAGKQCTAFAREGTVLCGRHSPREPKADGEAAPKKAKKVKNTDGTVCTALIKNGVNAGKQCTAFAREGTVLCGRHSPREPKADGEAAPKKVEEVKKD